MFHSPKRCHGNCCPLHLYQWHASALTAGTWCRIITTTNRDLDRSTVTGTRWGWRLVVGQISHSPIARVLSPRFVSHFLLLDVFFAYSECQQLSSQIPDKPFGSKEDQVEIINFHLPSSISCHLATPSCQFYSGIPALASHMLTDDQCLQQHLFSNAERPT